MKPYNAAEIPEYTPLDQRGEYEKWMKMMSETEDDRRRLGEQKMETLDSLLSKIPGFKEMQSNLTNMVNRMSTGQLTETHQQVLEQEAGGLRQRMGLQGSQAGLNMTLASFGRAGLQAQQTAMGMIPQLMSTLSTSFMGNIANDPSVMGPSYSQWSAQAQADHRDIYDSRVAQAQATHQANMLNTQYNIQQAEAARARSEMNAANAAAEARANRMAAIQTQNMVASQNAASYGAALSSSSNPFTGGLRGYLDRRAAV